ncbi:MAG: AAA family ATPase [Desulfobacter sp.]
MTGNRLCLKVKKALPGDVGRGVIRIPSSALSSLGKTPGDVVKINAGSSTVARLLPVTGQCRPGVAHIDGMLRKNAGAGIDENISITPVKCRDARSLMITPVARHRNADSESPLSRGIIVTPPFPPDTFDPGYIRKQLKGIPVLTDNLLRIKLFGTQTIDFKIISTIPDGAVTISPSTRIELEQSESAWESMSSMVCYEDIGGLDNEILRIREMVELPLKYPRVFEQLGVIPPKGLLIHGPPGCGKALMAKAAANETNAFFTYLSIPELINTPGCIHASLRHLLEQAADKTPGIIFLDEIDAAAFEDQDVSREKQVKKSIVNGVSALLDGLPHRCRVRVIGTATDPNAVLPSLRHSGRFERDIRIGFPNEKARLDILSVHTRGMPLANDVDLSFLAKMSYGYTGADFELLCREAAMACLRQLFPKIDFEAARIPGARLHDLKVKSAHFVEAMKNILPTGDRKRSSPTYLEYTSKKIRHNFFNKAGLHTHGYRMLPPAKPVPEPSEEAPQAIAGPDIELVCRAAAMNAIREYIDLSNGLERDPDFTGFKIHDSHFDRAVSEYVKWRRQSALKDKK